MRWSTWLVGTLALTGVACGGTSSGGGGSGGGSGSGGGGTRDPGLTGLDAYCAAAIPCGVSSAASVDACVVEEQARLDASSGGAECDAAVVDLYECFGLHATCGDDGSGTQVFFLDASCNPAFDAMTNICFREAVGPLPGDPDYVEPVETGRTTPAVGESYCAFVVACSEAGGEAWGTEQECEESLAAEKATYPGCEAPIDGVTACYLANMECVAFSDGTTEFEVDFEACFAEEEAYYGCVGL